MDPISSEDLDFTVSLFDCHDEYEILRGFSATIRYLPEEADEPSEIGHLTGWLTRRAYANLAMAGDALSSDAMILGYAAQKLVEACSDDVVLDSVLMLDRATLQPEYRGHKLFGAIVDGVMDMLQFDPSETIVVVFPEPLPLIEGEPRATGVERERGMQKLESALIAGGFEPYGDDVEDDEESIVWWRPLVGLA